MPLSRWPSRCCQWATYPWLCMRSKLCSGTVLKVHPVCLFFFNDIKKKKGVSIFTIFIYTHTLFTDVIVVVQETASKALRTYLQETTLLQIKVDIVTIPDQTFVMGVFFTFFFLLY